MSSSVKSHASIGFTLIELLVVIDIIAILAAILFPVFAKVREKARQTSCASNQKQIGLAIMQYVQDFDETYPKGHNWSNRISGWAGQIYPYIKSAAVFTCPSDGGAKSWSYIYNGNILKNAAQGDTNTPAVLADFNSPSKTILIAEGTSHETAWWGQVDISDMNPDDQASDLWKSGYSMSGFGGGLDYDPYNGSVCCGQEKYATGYLPGIGNSYKGDYDSSTGRHTDGANYIFSDGHVKWSRPSAISGGYNNSTNGDPGTPDQKLAANTNNNNPQVAYTWSIY